MRVSLPEGETALLRVLSAPLLTQGAASDIVLRADQESDRLLVTYHESSSAAREILRSADVSYTGDDGHVFVRAPGILIERHGRRRSAPDVRAPEDEAIRNPFAKRSSRVPRWLLMNQDAELSVSELARAVALNSATVSRVLRALEADALLSDAETAATSRRRRVRLARPRALLDLWLPLWQRRRVRRLRWDIGAQNVDEALSLLRTASDQTSEWAIGGLAGAATIRRAVEPAEVLVWASAGAVTSLERVLRPLPIHHGRGVVRIAVTPDPWTLGLAGEAEGLPIADPVQLWLDCASEGERALEAADAIAKARGWG